MRSKYYLARRPLPLAVALALAGHRVAESPLAGGRPPAAVAGSPAAGRRPLFVAAPRRRPAAASAWID
jgi:hypothetical protein